jgi:N4-gp56 family major capsid protein
MAISGVNTANGVTGLPQALLAVYSREIMHKALPAMRYEQFAVIKDELTRQPGLTITFTAYDNLALGGQLTEGVDIVPKALSASQISIMVTEWGNAIAVTELLLQTSYDDVLSEAAWQLGRDYARVVDLMLRNTVMSATNTVFATGATTLATTAALLSVADFRRATEILYMYNAPKFGGDFYVCFIHPHQATSLKTDPEWVSISTYAAPNQIFRGEIGRFDDVRFIVTSHQNNGAVSTSDPSYDATLVGTGAASVNLYKAAVLADNAYAWAIGLPVEMRDNGVQDFGRKHGLAWYSIMGSGVINNNNIVIIVSA